MSCLLRHYQPGDGEGITSVVNRAFGRDPQHHHHGEDWFPWKYVANPFGFRTTVLEDAQGTIVGHYGGLRTEVILDGTPRSFTQIVDACVDLSLTQGIRRGQLFRQLARAGGVGFSAEEGDDAGFGLPTPEHFDIGSRIVGYWMLRSQPMLVCHRPARTPKVSDGLKVFHFQECPEAVDDFLADLQSSSRCMGVRSREFLNWRFRDHPERNYEGAFAQDASGAVRGMAYYQRGRLFGRDVGILMDWLVPADDDEAASGLLEWASWHTTQDGLKELWFLCPPTCRWSVLLQDWGFRLQPTEYAMAFRSFRDCIRPGFLREHWYYTFADLDLV